MAGRQPAAARDASNLALGLSPVQPPVRLVPGDARLGLVGGGIGRPTCGRGDVANADALLLRKGTERLGAPYAAAGAVVGLALVSARLPMANPARSGNAGVLPGN